MKKLNAIKSLSLIGVLLIATSSAYANSESALSLQCQGQDANGKTVQVSGQFEISKTNSEFAEILGNVNIGKKNYPSNGIKFMSSTEVRISSNDRKLMMVLNRKGVSTLIIKNQNAFLLTCQ